MEQYYTHLSPMLFRAAKGIHIISLRGNLFRSREVDTAKQVGRILLVAIEHIGRLRNMPNLWIILE